MYALGVQTVKLVSASTVAVVSAELKLKTKEKKNGSPGTQCRKLKQKKGQHGTRSRRGLPIALWQGSFSTAKCMSFPLLRLPSLFVPVPSAGRSDWD